MRIGNKNYGLQFFLLVSAILLLAGFSTLYFYHKIKNTKVTSNGIVDNSGNIGDAGSAVVMDNSVLIEDNDGVKKVKVETGEVEDASSLEREDFSDFSGLPTDTADKSEMIVQSKVLVSQDKSEALLVFTRYLSPVSKNENDNQLQVLNTSEFVCDVAQKKCQPSEIFSQEYAGLDVAIQRANSFLFWMKWDSAKKILYGSQSSDDGNDVAPIYACNTEQKTCNKAGISDEQKAADSRVVVPDGSFSSDLGKFVMLDLHDQPNVQTGKKWEMMLFSSDDISKTMRSYDLSLIIDHDDNIGYDAVHSVAWSGDGKKIAIGTTRRIFILNVETGSVSLAYMAPADEEGTFYWDSSALYLSPDGGAVVFVDSNVEDQSADQTEDVSINALKKIDLSRGNSVTKLLERDGLSLKL